MLAQVGADGGISRISAQIDELGRIVTEIEQLWPEGRILDVFPVFAADHSATCLLRAEPQQTASRAGGIIHFSEHRLAPVGDGLAVQQGT